MSETRTRLEEARYFLNRMTEILKGQSASSEFGHFAFRCELNAFLSFARSVTTLPKPFLKNHRFVMENEFHNKSGFRAWYDTQALQMQSDHITKFFADQRNISIHEGSVKPHGITSINIVEYNAVTSIGVAVSIPVNATEAEAQELIARATLPEPAPPSIRPTETTTEQSWYFAGLPGGMIPQNEVIAVCAQYLAKIEQLVNDCEALFPSSFNRV